MQVASGAQPTAPPDRLSLPKNVYYHPQNPSNPYHVRVFVNLGTQNKCLHTYVKTVEDAKAQVAELESVKLRLEAEHRQAHASKVMDLGGYSVGDGSGAASWSESGYTTTRWRMDEWEAAFYVNIIKSKQRYSSQRGFRYFAGTIKAKEHMPLIHAQEPHPRQYGRKDMEVFNPAYDVGLIWMYYRMIFHFVIAL
jgi:hypothetical protein